jgi:hypothetical protein
VPTILHRRYCLRRPLAHRGWALILILTAFTCNKLTVRKNAQLRMIEHLLGLCFSFMLSGQPRTKVFERCITGSKQRANNGTTTCALQLRQRTITLPLRNWSIPTLATGGWLLQLPPLQANNPYFSFQERKILYRRSCLGKHTTFPFCKNSQYFHLCRSYTFPCLCF